jgi:hypothetical protein
MPVSVSALAVESFQRSREQFESLVGVLADPETGQRTHAELEDQLSVAGRELMRTLLQDHVDLRASREVRVESVTGADGVERRAVEPAHERGLATVFGEVRVTRLAYRTRGAANLSPADAVLNLPGTKHSHGLRRLAAIESTRGSFQAAGEAIGRVCGTALGKRQVEELAQAAAVDVDAFYTAGQPEPAGEGEVLALSVDGKGIVMRPEALREPTRRAAASSSPPVPGLSGGYRPGRKRMAEVGAVYDATPVIRTPADILADPDHPGERVEGPLARNKWLTASITDAAAEVIAAVLDEAERRDPEHTRCWVGLVDGNNHQIQTLSAEAKRRKVQIHIVIDFIHVLEYLWQAARCFFPDDDPAAQHWVSGHARRILTGQAPTVAAAIRRKATTLKLTSGQRERADTCASYLLNKQRYLNYPLALQAGWPIATGVIEGACRHLIQDRMDLTGARWGLTGAEATLKLRTVISNGDFDAYWTYHLTQEQHRVHYRHYWAEHPPTP